MPRAAPYNPSTLVYEGRRHINSLEEMSMACPAIARGSLFIRPLTRLYRIRNP